MFFCHSKYIFIFSIKVEIHLYRYISFWSVKNSNLFYRLLICLHTSITQIINWEQCQAFTCEWSLHLLVIFFLSYDAAKYDETIDKENNGFIIFSSIIFLTNFYLFMHFDRKYLIHFFFSQPMLKSPVYCLPIIGGRTDGFMPLPRVLALCQIQTALSSIWTLLPLSFPTMITIMLSAPAGAFMYSYH